MSKADHRLIANLVNANGEGLPRFEVIPRMHHSIFWHKSLEDGFNSFASGVYKPYLAEKVMDWMRKVME